MIARHLLLNRRGTRKQRANIPAPEKRLASRNAANAVVLCVVTVTVKGTVAPFVRVMVEGDGLQVAYWGSAGASKASRSAEPRSRGQCQRVAGGRSFRNCGRE